MFLENCGSRGNKRNYRLWSKGKLSSCHSEDPKWRGGTGGAAHFSFHGAAGRFVIDRPIVRADADNAAPVFLIETSIPLTLDIINANMHAPPAPIPSRRQPPPPKHWSPPREQQTNRIATHTSEARPDGNE